MRHIIIKKEKGNASINVSDGETKKNTKGWLGEEQLETKGITLGERIRARAAENVARIRGESDIEAAGLRPGTPIMPYQAVSGVEGTSVLDKRTGKFMPPDMIRLPLEIQTLIDKIRNTSEFDEWYRSQDKETRSLVRQYLGK